MKLFDLIRKNRKGEAEWSGEALPEMDTGSDIKVLGTGCENCQKMRENTNRALKELGVTAHVDMITDLKKIMGYGVIAIPTLVIKGQVVSSGKLLKTEQIKKLCEKYELSTTVDGKENL